MEGFRRVDEWRLVEQGLGSFESKLVRDPVAIDALRIDDLAAPGADRARGDRRRADGARHHRGEPHVELRRLPDPPAVPRGADRPPPAGVTGARWRRSGAACSLRLDGALHFVPASVALAVTPAPQIAARPRRARGAPRRGAPRGRRRPRHRDRRARASRCSSARTSARRSASSERAIVATGLYERRPGPPPTPSAQGRDARGRSTSRPSTRASRARGGPADGARERRRNLRSRARTGSGGDRAALEGSRRLRPPRAPPRRRRSRRASPSRSSRRTRSPRPRRRATLSPEKRAQLDDELDFNRPFDRDRGDRLRARLHRAEL